MMNKRLWLIIGLVGIGLVFSGCRSFKNDSQNNKGDLGQESTRIDSVCLEDTCFKVEIADNSLKRQRGLMGREKLAKDEGMLFVFETLGSPQFWMKNTLIPLDILWLDNNGKIVHIEENVPPCDESNFQEGDRCPSYGPDDSIQAKYVLEINGGIVEEKNIQVGDSFTFTKY